MRLISNKANKGLVSEIRPWQEMPKDKYGIYADIIMDPPSPVKRMNVDPEQMLNRIGLFVVMRMEELYNKGDFEGAFATLVDWFNDVHPAYAELTAKKFSTPERRKKAAKDFIAEGIYLHIPPTLKTINRENLDIWEEKWGAQPTPVTFTAVDYFGNKVERTTEEPFSIGDSYFMRLCKDGKASSTGVSTASHHGNPITPPKVTNSSAMYKKKPSRRGEDENRNLSDADPKEVLRSSRLTSRSPRAVERICVDLYHSATPTNIGRFDITDEELAAMDVIAAQFHHLMAITGVETYDTLNSEDDPDRIAPDDYIGQ